ncbi:E2.7.1.20 [Lepeophtheirus salmonis]|uniref:Adenosine kinase n=1 Tax=Lepeophtheirus salmonis TaxID=72036 RepID=A0A7R8D6K6_LEPSM|nr:E2.7.1.20 [Lepeophtheirus salmonis]CAF3044673.1 E2.7.1.20 [Lepeophtheirus salmonis]
MESAPILAAFGNPLLDFILRVNDEEEKDLVRKYDLSKHDAMELDTIQSGLFHDAMNWHGKITISPGGCSLNTCRVLQWLHSHRPGTVLFFGSVGKDEQHFNLKKLCVKDNISTRLREVEDSLTGHCIVLANGQERTLVANIGAANQYSLKHLIQHESLLKDTPMIYVEGFFLNHSPKASNYLALLSNSSDKIFTFNLCGSYVCREKEYVENVMNIFPQINVLFGNAYEFEAFNNTSRQYGLKGIDFLQEEMEFSTLEGKEGECGYYLFGSGKRKKKLRVPVKRIPKDEIRDTVGAGDSFIAGYLYGIILGKTNRECIEHGVIASHMIIRQNGVTLPAFQ